MAEVTLRINGRNYGLACDDGQEERVKALGAYVDQRVKEIAQAGMASSESHLMFLLSIILADEVFELKDGLAAANGNARSEPLGLQMTEAEEAEIVQTIDNLAARIDSIAGNIGKL